MLHSLDSRITFHHNTDILEIDLTDLVLSDGLAVRDLFDLLDRRIRETGRKWFFLVNYLRCQIYPAAWIDFAHRGKKLNVASSLGTVRFNTDAELGDEIKARANHERFDANLAASRVAALAELEILRQQRGSIRRPPMPLDPVLVGEFHNRIRLDADNRIAEIDFGGFTFTDSRVVDGFFDAIEERIVASGRTKWYFLVNYQNCQVMSEAWIAFANRGRRLATVCSLGSVRYVETGEARRPLTERSDAVAEDYPNRDMALRMIDRMRHGQSVGAGSARN